MSGLTILIGMGSLCRKCLNDVPYERRNVGAWSDGHFVLSCCPAAVSKISLNQEFEQ